MVDMVDTVICTPKFLAANCAVLCANFLQNASRIHRLTIGRRRKTLFGGVAGHACHSLTIDALWRLCYGDHKAARGESTQRGQRYAAEAAPWHGTTSFFARGPAGDLGVRHFAYLECSSAT